MSEFWESKFKSEGAMWDFFPSDSAIRTLEIFKANKFKRILIPGIGYGRNAKLFIDNGFEVTGIEISGSAIELAKSNGVNCLIHHGSVTSMPFDDKKYDGIFCYALLHLLNRTERQNFLKACTGQLEENGLMVFVLASKQTEMYGRGRYLSKDRYGITEGLKVFFYDMESAEKEFSAYGIIECREIEEPVKFMKDHESMKHHDSMKMLYVIASRRV